MKPNPALAELHDLYQKHEVVRYREAKDGGPWRFGFCHSCGRPLYYSIYSKGWVPLKYNDCIRYAADCPKRKKYWLRVAKGAEDAPV